MRRADPSSRVVVPSERERECVIECYQVQQSTSTSTSRRDRTKKERNINVSEVVSNKLEQAMMLLTCIRPVVVSE